MKTQALALVALLPLAACSLGLERDAPEQARYLILARRPTDAAAPTAAPGDRRLEVRTFHAASPFATSGFVYRLDETRYDTDFYRAFLVPPERMLAELTRDWLADAGVAAAVLGPGSRTAPTHALEADVTTLVADYRDPGAPTAVVALRVFVVRLPDTVLMQRSYEEAEPIPDGSADRLAEAAGRAFARVLERLEADVGAALGDG